MFHLFTEFQDWEILWVDWDEIWHEHLEWVGVVSNNKNWNCRYQYILFHFRNPEFKALSGLPFIFSSPFLFPFHCNGKCGQRREGWLSFFFFLLLMYVCALVCVYLCVPTFVCVQFKMVGWIGYNMYLILKCFFLNAWKWDNYKLCFCVVSLLKKFLFDIKLSVNV